jgi:hypothetical protein
MQHDDFCGSTLWTSKYIADMGIQEISAVVLINLFGGRQIGLYF